MAKIVKLIFPLFILLLSLYPADALFAQAQLRGTVVDSLRKPIPFTQVLLKKAGNKKIVAFARCDQSGAYQLEIKKPGAYELIFNAISYHAVSKELRVGDMRSDTVLVQNAVLKDNPISFDEVVVQAERPIQVRGDTVTYNVEDFARGDETVVEDLLKKLPGVDVDSEGTVRFGGKEVEKVMVEGTDIFGRGYGMITKNLDAQSIDKVRALQNYSDTPELRGLENSDKVALDLSLKEDAGTSLFGNSTLGYNSSGNHDGRLVLMSIDKKTKHYAFLNSNAIGYDPLNNISSFLRSDDLRDEVSGLAITDLKSMIGLNGSTLGLSDRRVRFNNSSMASYNIIFTPSEKLEVKALGFGTYEKDQFNRSGLYSYDTQNRSFENHESHSLTNRVKNGFAKVEATYLPDDKSRLIYRGKFYRSSGEDESSLVFNDEEGLENLSTKSVETSHIINYTGRINEKNALQASVSYEYQTLDEGFGANPFIPVEVFGASATNHFADQNNSSGLTLASVNAKLLSRFRKNFVWETHTGLQYSDLTYMSRVTLDGTPILTQPGGRAFENNFSLNTADAFLGVRGEVDFGKVSVYAGTNMHTYSLEKTDITDRSREHYFYLEPKIGFEWKPDNKNTMEGRYLYNATSNSLKELMNGYIFTGNRTFVRGLGGFQLFRGHNLLFTYSHGGWMEQFLLNATVYYKNQGNYFQREATLLPDYNLIGVQVGDSQDLWYSELSLDTYFFSLKNNLKLKASVSNARSESRINGILFPYKYLSSSFGFEIRSVFESVFNYTVGSSWSFQRSRLSGKNSSNELMQFADIYLDFSRKLKAKIIGERYYFGSLQRNRNYYFLDGELNYKIARNKWELKVKGRNLLNTNTFRKYFLTDIGEELITHRIVPRYVLLSLYFRF